MVECFKECVKAVNKVIGSFFKPQKPVIKENTFLVWEPCKMSHAEVVPGYAKYLLDLGYHVSIIVNPKRYKEGLFSRFKDDNISLNKISRSSAKKYFKKSNLDYVKGLMVTTVGKICDSVNYNQCFEHFAPNLDKKKLFLVEHEAKASIDADNWSEKLITLRELNYKGAKSTVINPHYFGDVKITDKNAEITNFITIGAINPKRKNSNIIINAVKELYSKGITNFKVTVVGKGHLKDLDKELRPFFDIKGRLPFDKMYDELEKADFMLTAYDETNPLHKRYITTGTSGNFQLVYGFLKPCLILEEFSALNGFNSENSIFYKSVKDYSKAMEKAIKMTKNEYFNMQQNLKKHKDELYEKSLNNLKTLISNN